MVLIIITYCAIIRYELFHSLGAHFSALYGNTHKVGGSIWQQGALASSGIEQMAETGGTSILSSEIIALINGYGAESLVAGAGSSATDMTEVEFEISETHPLFSMVSMIAPSPDWFIGVNDLDLRENGLWRNSYSVDLFPYDSGTDNGVAFTSSNSNTFPQEPIEQIITTPFPNGVRLGRFVFDLISTAGVPMPENIFANGFE